MERAVAPLLQQRELREARDLAVHERDEDSVRVIAGAAHVAGEPLFESADVVLFLPGDVAGRLACDLPIAPRQLGPVRHVTISTPGGGAGSGASIAVRSRTTRELRPASV